MTIAETRISSTVKNWIFYHILILNVIVFLFWSCCTGRVAATTTRPEQDEKTWTWMQYKVSFWFRFYYDYIETWWKRVSNHYKECQWFNNSFSLGLLNWKRGTTSKAIAKLLDIAVWTYSMDAKRKTATANMLWTSSGTLVTYTEHARSKTSTVSGGCHQDLRGVSCEVLATPYGKHNS